MVPTPEEYGCTPDEDGSMYPWKKLWLYLWRISWKLNLHPQRIPYIVFLLYPWKNPQFLLLTRKEFHLSSAGAEGMDINPNSPMIPLSW